ncbi:MAG TPA: NUDIX domain-containing protein [Nocardioidaceae bacterium]|nr:NUDIX domain-containing protein [Nocardioidaceae bacterium]
MAHSSDYPQVAVAVDLAVLAVDEGELLVLTVRRGAPPYAGRRALPGGFLEPTEDLHQAARRELREETGVKLTRAHLEQLGAYGAPRRDPRGRILSVAHLVLVPEATAPAAGSDASSAQWEPVDDLLASPRKLAFDHARILRDAVERLQESLESTSLATRLCRAPFTVAELRGVYEVVWGHELDPRNFHRKMTGTPGLLVDTGKVTTRNGGRPAALYRAGSAVRLNPPLARP